MLDKIIGFATDNYLIFTIISGFLILALIGYIVENKSGRDIKIKKKGLESDNIVSNQAPIINQPENNNK